MLKINRTFFSVAGVALWALLVGTLALLAGCSAKIERDGLKGETPAAMPAPSASAGDTPASPPIASPGATGDDSDGGPPAEDDAGADADVDGATAFPGFRCGAAPYVPLRVGARDIMPPGSGEELTDVTVTLKHCPARSFKIPADGPSQILVSEGAVTWIRFEASGYLPWVEGEVLVSRAAQTLTVEATLVPTAIAASIVPAWKTDQAIIYVEVRTGRSIAAEACRSPAGVTLTVKGHPEASVLYRDKGANAGYRGSPATSEEGIAVIANLGLGLQPLAGLPSLASPAGTVELTAAKPGCVYQPAYGDANSLELLPLLRAPLFRGAITHQVINPVR